MTWSIRSLVFVALSCLAIIAPQGVQADEKTAYPIVIKHAFGTTTIEKKPKRIVTVAWANHEVPLHSAWFLLGLREPISVMRTMMVSCLGWPQS